MLYRTAAEDLQLQGDYVVTAVYRFKKARLHSESNFNIPASNNTQNENAPIQEPMLVDLGTEGPSQGTQEPDQKPKDIKVPIETPAQSGANIIVIEKHELPGEASKNPKRKKGNLGPQKKIHSWTGSIRRH